MRTPLFWEDKSFVSTALLPLAAIYGIVAAGRRTAGTPEKLSVPILCVGNIVAGGAGKTPVALALGGMLKAAGKRVHFLTRGYKGSLAGPLQVDPKLHTAADVGDEPLLLAELLPTWVAKDRVQGAKAAIAASAEMIIMDDGFQNPSLYKDISLLVLDGHHGFGNGRLLPAGPLREPIAEAMKRATLIVLLGEDTRGVLKHVPQGKPVFRAHMKPVTSAESLGTQPVVAFAGIARPRKFYRTLQQMDVPIRKMVAYPDHHKYTPVDLAFLRAKAKEYAARLVTTSKDYARLPDDMRADVTKVEVEVVFDDAGGLLKAVLA